MQIVRLAKLVLVTNNFKRNLMKIAFEKYPVGSIINGTVRDVKDYGAFVLIEDNIDGLVPVSEISHSFTKNPADVLKPGDSVTAQIIRFEDNRITLSIKALIAKEEKQVEEVVSEEAYQEAKEKRAKKNAKKFDTASATSAPVKRVKAVKKEEEEVSSWSSDENATATMADLFKGLKLDIKE